MSRLLSKLNSISLKFYFSISLPKPSSLDVPPKSGSLPNQDLQNEVQDFSMPSKKHLQVGSGGSSGSSSGSNATSIALAAKASGNKLDDTLTKLMKRKNCVSITFK